MSTRREFIEAVGLGAGAWAAGLGALSCALPVVPPVQSSGAEAWHVDDMWGHRPRYAQVIAPHVTGSPYTQAWDLAAPADRMFCI